ncbi:MAG: cation transport regulator ChaB [Cyanobacteria bacterium QH_8_48_120]|nr:MAG: cation transport regulator ChaB [Cyanobacteria bacterium QH_1_48_107]PSO56284.1 MAG: cation transport regulator ChaB [Cyanobacteria bacterium QH_10_48_56]PSO56835.1 MAG: cation transport regulator ChaB [Cyanobacteria bacterium QH_7_48_89]PSO64102.1 MAG: cation transport regulator ChaB [Cyanobacteria bacterium QH_6_48_35]PSO68032.1 MAG: cation transport regulator ChaB [Cyanobacteria bacterium QS_1_48_34]PSO69985.1 MAG: cation transport regulator ChaB [Cyanobacteria bacterium QH_8_48_120
MSYNQIEDLPNEVKEKLPHEAQKIFFAAFNSASSDGLSKESASQVAWNSIENSHYEGDDGKWYRRDQAGKGVTPPST